MTTPTPDLLTRYHPTTKLANIPWEELPPPLQATCERFIESWWANFPLNQPIEASGLADITLAEVFTLQAPV